MQKNLFISWSGDLSHRVATVLRKWLPHFIHNVDPFLSSEDINMGARWFTMLGAELEQISFSICCVTRSNVNAPWLLFEAGALSKSLGGSRVCPLVIDLAKSDLTGPLTHFQSASLTRNDFKQLIESINDHLGERQIPRVLLDGAFDLGWSQFDHELRAALDTEPATEPVLRSPTEILDELLQLTRNIAQQVLKPAAESVDIDVARLLRVSSPEEAVNLITRLNELSEKDKQMKSIDVLSHELLSPIIGIKSNTSFLQRRIHELTPEKIDGKFSDVLADCEILLHRLDELRYALGKEPFKSRPERFLLFKDVILKMVNDLKPLLRDRGLDPSRIEFNVHDLNRVSLIAHKAWLKQVVYNLLINAIKYAEHDANEFRLRFSVDDTADYYTIIFMDWGIGITQGMETKIFEYGFRSPEAMRVDVTGAGLGLTIAQRLMRDQGGDLILTNNYKPTEFRLLLPKNLKESQV